MTVIPDAFAIEDRLKAESLLLEFFLGLDTGNFGSLADCMAEDGEWHRQGKVLRGHKMILVAMAERGPDVRTAHLVSSFRVISREGTAAEARFYMAGYRFDGRVDDEQPSPMNVPFSIGLYHCRFTQEPAEWKIAELRGMSRFRRSTKDSDHEAS